MKLWTWPSDRQSIANFFHIAEQGNKKIDVMVSVIIREIARDGDEAVSRLIERFDKAQIQPGDFAVPAKRLEKAWNATPKPLQNAMKKAHKRITDFHKKQRLKGWTVREPGFGRIDQRVEPLDRVAVYVPGGRAPLPSSVLMNVVPAKVAGVREIVLVTPPGPEGWPHESILAAAHLAGVDKVLRIGGAQAIAALAMGTKSIRRVDKIVGPGSAWVATAKKQLYGLIDIDSIAGPSEVLILADLDARLDWIAADMLAQAEHGEDSSSGVVLIGGGKRRAELLQEELDKQLADLPRREFAEPALEKHGYMILVRTPEQAIEIANMKAPEHLEIMAAGARKMSDQIRNAGAIFLGGYSPEALGDYMAGPNHTLPTGGTARFFSPLSVWAFYKTSHVIEATRQGLTKLSKDIVELAEAESLTAHARTVRMRQEN